MAEKSDNLAKNPDDMNADELEKFIKAGGKTEPEQKIEEPKKEEAKKDDTKPQPNQDAGKTEQKKVEANKEVKPEQKPEQLILGKFKSPDEVIKAYQELEKLTGKKESEKSAAQKKAAQMRKLLEEKFDFDEEDNIVGVKPQAYPQQQFQPQGNPITELKRAIPAFEKVDDDVLMGILQVNAMMTGRSLSEAAKGFEEKFESRLKGVDEIVFERAVEKQKKSCRSNPDFKDFSKLEPDIDAALEKLPPNIRGKEGAVENVYWIIRGQKADMLAQERVNEVQTQVNQAKSEAEDAFVEGTGKTSVATPPVNVGEMSSDDLEKHINKLIKSGKAK